jgi:DNA ligase-1
MKIGKPIEPMLAYDIGGKDTKFAEVIKKHRGKTLAEIKYDGYRLQVHKGNETTLFTRGLNSLDIGLFSDVEKQIRNLPKGIYDGEILGLGSRLDAFTAIKKRVRGEVNQTVINQYPLQVRFFDVLQLENRELIQSPLTERRRVLENYVENISEQFVFEDFRGIKNKFAEVTENDYEGLVCKRPDSEYIIGGRTSDWIKLKKFITLDLVVLGIYAGEGKASKLPFAAVLAGTRNKDKYETIVKVGISNRALIGSLYERIHNGLQQQVPRDIVLSENLQKKTFSRKLPTQYVNPTDSAVLEIKCLDVSRSDNWHSCGFADGEAYSLRIASIERIREDKKIQDATTTQQIAEIYSSTQ